MLNVRPEAAWMAGVLGLCVSTMGVKHTYLGIILTLFLSTPALAGGGLTWIESVTIDYQLESITGQINTTTTAYPLTGPSFSVANFLDGRVKGGSQYMSLIDFQGTAASTTVYVTYAGWNFDASTGGVIPVTIYSYPSSPSPPSQLANPPTGSLLREVDVPAGDYSSSPYAITLSGINTDGGTCILLGTVDRTNQGPGYVAFTASLDPPSVPEPPSFFMLAVTMLALVSGIVGKTGCGPPE